MADKRPTRKIYETEAVTIELVKPVDPISKWRFFVVIPSEPDIRPSAKTKNIWVKQRYHLAHNGVRFAESGELHRAKQRKDGMVEAIEHILATEARKEYEYAVACYCG